MVIKLLMGEGKLQRGREEKSGGKEKNEIINLQSIVEKR